MKKYLVAGFSLVPLSLAWLAADELVFDPPEGTRLTKMITTVIDVRVDEVSITGDGESFDAIPQMAFEIVLDRSCILTDAYLAMTDGQPIRLQRSFDELGRSLEVGLEMDGTMLGPLAVESSSPLEGEAVLFAWDEEAQKYELSFLGEEEPDEALLEGLELDLDLPSLLPEGPVEAGATWTIEPMALIGVLLEGSDLKLAFELEDEDYVGPYMTLYERAGQRFGGPLARMLEGEVRCTYRGLREVEGLRAGAIGLEWTLSISDEVEGEMAELLLGIWEMNDDEAELEVTSDRVSFDFTSSGKGELLWDAEENHVRSLRLEGRLDLTCKARAQVASEDEEHLMQFSFDARGSLEHDVTLR